MRDALQIRMRASAASSEDVAELLGERADESIVERVVATGASLAQISEALDDLEHEVRFDEHRDPSSPMVAEVRTILEELPFEKERVYATDDEAEPEEEELTIVDAEDLVGAER